MNMRMDRRVANNDRKFVMSGFGFEVERNQENGYAVGAREPQFEKCSVLGLLV